MVYHWASQMALVLKNPLANAEGIRDMGSIHGLGRSSGGGNGNPLQYSCLENPMDRGARWATVHGVTKSWIRLKLFSIHAHSLSLLTKEHQKYTFIKVKSVNIIIDTYQRSYRVFCERWS